MNYGEGAMGGAPTPPARNKSKRLILLGVVAIVLIGAAIIYFVR